jgi:hypothetical protein
VNAPRKPIFNAATRKAIVECARRCERGLRMAECNTAEDYAATASEWRERAEWWACQAFREVDAALAAKALEAVA